MTAPRPLRRPARHTGRARRPGFTLIELMIVIVIIALLMALLIPVLGGAMQNARQAQVQTEISGLEYAITDFKNNFGAVPPSYIDFRRAPSGGFAKARTQSLLRRLWPQIDLAAAAASPQIPDREIGGSECLVFFLGGIVPSSTPTTAGMPDTDGDGLVDNPPNGFSSNPRAPFAPGGKRVGPFFEFKSSRFVLSGTPAQIVGYRDPLPDQQLPYFYITPDQYLKQEQDNQEVNTPVPPAAAKRPVYRQSATKFFNAQSYQIISPGYDGATGEHNTSTVTSGPSQGLAYGIGGIFNPSKGTIIDRLLPMHPEKGKVVGDFDNITNFNSGPLVP